MIKVPEVFSESAKLIKESIFAYVEDGALSRGAAIAFYIVTSLAPILLIVIAIVGLLFGRDAAENAITGQLSGLMGKQSADVIQSAIASAASKSSGILATIVGLVTLGATASGAFGEIQNALNEIWGVEPKGSTLSRIIRTRATSLGLVAVLGFILVVSLVVSAGVAAFSHQIDSVVLFGSPIIFALNGMISFVLISFVFAAIYKLLPDVELEWRDAIVGAVVTAILLSVGRSFIGWYIGSSAIASSYGAAGGLIVLLFWVYYSVQMFLLGAEFTKVYAGRHGSR